MDFSSNNIALWSPMVQIGVIAGLVLLANVLCRKIAFFRNSMMPTAVLAGFLLLLLRNLNVVPIINTNFLETVTYHAIALGFIALSLRVPEKNEAGGTLLASKNGALIVSTYLVQGIIGMVVSLGVAYLVNPDFFKASGILLAMAYGQGPGQANNVGSTYEALGMHGGRSFGLSLAAAGYLCACVVGVVFINIWNRKGKLRRSKGGEAVSGSVAVDTFQHQNEIPVAESIDKLSIQAALIALVYLLTYLVTRGLCALVGSIAPGALKTVLPLLWGFNFIIGSLVATITRVVMKRLRRVKLMNRQYKADRSHVVL